MSEEEYKLAISAITKFRDSVDAGHRFPPDEVWQYYDGTQLPDSAKKPAITKYLVKEGYIAATGETTKAGSGPRKGSPTTEYTFGLTVCSESVNLISTTGGPAVFAQNEPKKDGVAKPHNSIQRIIYGCPGSGKSYLLKKDASSAHWATRTVFHPATRYTDFVGGLRPESIYKVEDSSPATYIGSQTPVEGEPYVRYVFQPGPMMMAYSMACQHQDKSIVLIIEELSRANAALVFGDMLQLLDRSEYSNDDQFKGVSEYEISPNYEIKNWLLENRIQHSLVSPGCVRFPPNLYIWATMNRSDQNARQVDTAFLRRWKKEYLSYLQPCVYDDLMVSYNGKYLSWGELRRFVNKKLKGIDVIPEDKYIGPYFLTEESLSDPMSICHDLWGYLWHDVLKNKATEYFNGAKTFSEVMDEWREGRGAPIGEIEGT